ncbi:peptidoglycan DD-metalloendopeptidase family protein [Luteimonas suaedae]|uniref:peptidoglycan DD-metalloendopeptidase family protein n=1 Tax=Luteimonas suaedae TaxID=2605430 RepID=UPI003CCDE6A4
MGGGRDRDRRTGVDGVARMRMAIVLVALVLLSACGSSRVIRESGTRVPQAGASTPKPGQTVTVKRGDTLYGLAIDNGISPLDLATWNSISPPYTIYPGQRLRLYPSGSGARTATTTPTRPPATGSTPPPAQPTSPTTAPARSSVAWRWPADGQIITRFANGDPTKQGIGIAGNGGQPVRAAGDGVVVYSGSGLVGYGELIIVKHDDQWLSAYGHNRARLVNEGERVRSGQQIAEMGRSGTARDMLHFEIRHNGKPVDPLAYLPRR